MSERWGPFSRSRALIGLGVACAVLGAVAPAVKALASSTPPPAWTTRTFQATSAAIPTEQNPSVVGSSTRFGSTNATRVHVVTTATASSTCDSCKGEAVTMQVVYVDGGMSIAADNAAAAWSAKCAHCGSSALSLQIVVFTGRRVVVSANNRALGVNAACLKCRTSAAAVQIVVRAPSTAKVSPQAMEQIRALRADLVRNLAAGQSAAAAPRQATSARAARARTAGAVETTTRRMQSVLSTDLHAISVSHRIVVR